MLKPPTNRISRITTRITLPRAIPTVQFWGFVIGAVTMAPIGGVITGATGAIIAGLIGGVLAVGLVRWRPWKGENLVRVLRVRAAAVRGKKVSQCPGSLTPVATDQAGAEYCSTCGLVCEIAELEGLSQIRVAVRHTWRRKIYIGIQPIQPVTGVVWIAPGSIPVKSVP